CVAGLIFWRLSWRRARPSRSLRLVSRQLTTPPFRTGQRRVLGSADVVGDELAGRARGGVEGGVPRREENVAAFKVQGTREMDGVVAAQGVLGGEITGVAGELLVDRDDAQFGVEILERGDRADLGRFVDAA